MIFTQKEYDFSHVKDYEMEAAKGVVVVEMHPREEKKGSLYLPDDVSTQTRSDLAIVVSSGREDIPIGSMVYVRHDRGKCVRGFGWTERIAKSETRFYGVNGGYDFRFTGTTAPCERYDVDEAIYCFHDMRPIGRNILIKLAPKPEEISGILVHQKHIQRDPVAEVVAVGNHVSSYKPGDKVVIHEGDLTMEEMAFLDAEGYEDHAFVREEFLYGRYTGT